MSSPHQYPRGFHVAHFDTTLLEQVIAVEVDIAVGRMTRESGRSIRDIDQHQWCQTILAHLSDAIKQQTRSHYLLPSALDAMIAKEIGALIDRELCRPRPLDCASFVAPFHGLLRLPYAGVLSRRLFEKRIE